MVDLIRQEIAGKATPIVVKVGTRVLTRANGQLDTQQIGHLADQFHRVIGGGRKIVLVSSGAVGAGMSVLGLKRRPQDLSRLQAVAAVGQANLIQAYEQRLGAHGHHTAQMLLTAQDLQDRTSYLNVRNTLLSLLELGALPIINENDTVAVEELMRTFGDNDRLAALVTNLLRAPLLIILSDVDGLFDGAPTKSHTRLISTVDRIDATIRSHVCDGPSTISKGGMASKLEAARMCTLAGENVILANGRLPHVIERIVAGEPLGTAFLAQGKMVSPRKRWIGFSARTVGSIRLDAGACRAVIHEGRSLLAIGIESVEGHFGKGDVVSLRDGQGVEQARGLSNYDATELNQIKGLHSDRFAETLGHCPHTEVIHRDNLAIVNHEHK